MTTKPAGKTRRRTVLKGLAAAAATAGVRPAGARTRPPNIILFLADDMRFDAAGAYGNRLVHTPVIDRLAARGTAFDRAYVTTSICPSSRATIFTGQYSRRHGVGAPAFLTPLDDRRFAETYPVLLRNAGYRTGFVGKFGIGRSFPADRFDHAWAFNDQGRYLHEGRDGEVRHLTSIMAERCLTFLRSQETDRPFCLSVSFKAPHADEAPDGEARFIADLQDLAHYRDVTFPIPPDGVRRGPGLLPPFMRERNEGLKRWRDRFERPGVQTVVRAYYALVTGLDRAMGAVLAAAADQGLLDDTVVIFTSDNGFYLGEYGLADKWFAHEPSIRVPLVIADFRQPGEAGGRRTDALALNLDLAPTILALAGIDPPTGMQGRDLSGLLAGRDMPDWRTDFLYEHLLESPTIPKSEGVVGERFKYVRYWRGADSFEEAFDLERDPHELRNLIADPAFGHRAERLRARTRELAEAAA